MNTTTRKAKILSVAIIALAIPVFSNDANISIWINVKYKEILDASGSLRQASNVMLETNEPVGIIENLDSGKFVVSYNFHESNEFNLAPYASGLNKLAKSIIADSVNLQPQSITLYKNLTQSKLIKFDQAKSFESSISKYFKQKFLGRQYNCDDDTKISISDTTLTISKLKTSREKFNLAFRIDYVEFSPTDNIILTRNDKILTYGIIASHSILQLYSLDEEQHYIKQLIYQCGSGE
jgi:hypothetical protein